MRPSKQPTNNNQHAEEEDEADLSGEDLDFLKEYGESIGFLTKIKAEDLTK